MKIIVNLVDHLHPLDLAVGEVLFFVRARTLLIAHLCLATCYVENQGHMIWISNEKAIFFSFSVCCSLQEGWEIQVSAEEKILVLRSASYEMLFQVCFIF